MRYTFKDYFPEYKNDRINDIEYQKEVTVYLNNIKDSCKLQEALAGFKENPPNKIHFCSSNGCLFCKKVINEIEKR